VASQGFEKGLKTARDNAMERVIADLDLRDSGRPLELAGRRGFDEGDLDLPCGSAVEHARRMGPATGRPDRPDYVSDA
jgi:hypothetical protein